MAGRAALEDLLAAGGIARSRGRRGQRQRQGGGRNEFKKLRHSQPPHPLSRTRSGYRCCDRSSSRPGRRAARLSRSEEHTSELQSLMRISYAVFCLKKKKI